MAYADEVLADTPLAYWKLDETSGAFADSTGNGRTLTVYGTVTRGVAPAFGTTGAAVTLDGTSGYLQSDQTINHSDFTIEVWYKGTDGQGVLASARPASGSAASITLGLGRPPVGGSNTPGRVVLGVDASDTWRGVQTSSVTVHDNVWHHIVGVWDGSSGASVEAAQFKIYVDGVQAATVDAIYNTLTAPISSGTSGFWFGHSAGGWPSNAYVGGSLDELALYGTALSAARVAAHYAPPPSSGAALRGTATATSAAAGTLSIQRSLAAAATATSAAAGTLSVAGAVVVPQLTGAATAGSAAAGDLAITGRIATTERRNLDTNSRARTGVGFIDLDVPVAPEPPTIHGAPIRVTVDTLPAPGITTGMVAPMTPTVLRDTEWGRVRLRVDYRDVTYLRDKPAQITDYQLLDPYGYGPATLRFPQITFWELPDFGTGDLSWLRKNAPVDIDHVKDGTQRRTMWLGHIDAFDFDTDGTLICDCSGELIGRMDKTHRTQRLVRAVRDAGYQARIALSIFNRRYRIKGSAADWGRTGIPMETTGGGMGTNLAYLDHVLATSVDFNLNSWTILPTEADPRLFDLVRRDTTTVHATVYLGARGVSARLRDDQLEQPNRMFGEGVAPDGARWRGAEYPNLGPEKVPAYPYTDNRTFGRIGLTDAGTDTGSGVSVLEDELLGSGLLGLSERSSTWSRRTTEAVEEVQRRAGLPVTGRVDPATWTAVFGDGISHQRLTQARIRPLVWDTATEKWLLSPNGSRLGRNPNQDRRVPQIERAVSFGEGVSKRRARRWLAREMRRAAGTNWRGTITLSSDVLAGEHTFGEPGTPLSRMDLRAGQNIRVKRFGSSAGMLMHVASVQVSGLDGESPQVELAVDTQFRDAIGLAEMIERDKAARRDPAREWLNQHRRSAQPSDAIVGWDREAGAGVVRRTELVGGQWNVIPVIGGQAGEVQRIDLQTRDAATEFICAVFARKVRPGDLQTRVGDPFADVTPGDVWRQVPVADWLAGLDEEEQERFEDERRRRDGFIKTEDGDWVPPEYFEGNIVRGDNGQWQSVDAPPSGKELADLIAEEVNNREELTADRLAAISDARVGVYVAGTTTQPCGYWPRKMTNDNGELTGEPVTGRWRDDASFSYWTVSLGSPWLYLAVFPRNDCTIHGRMYDQLIEGA